MTSEEKINAHTQSILQGNYSCSIKVCPKCNGVPGAFKPHERRSRTFFVIINRLIRKVITYLLRCECPLCNHTFTDYPDFAIPYKRYIKEEVLKKSSNYVRNPDTSYRKSVEVQGMPIGYEGKENKIDERILAPSTLWRWVGFVGSMNKALMRALKLIRQKAPSSKIFREPHLIHACKHQSDSRKNILQTCSQLFHAEEEFQNYFDASIFLHFATAHSVL